MRSSISASEPAAVAYAKGLAWICAILIIGLEVSSDYLLKHDSPTYARISQQYEQALKNPSRWNQRDRKSTRLNSSHRCSSYAVFCLKKKKCIYLVFHIIASLRRL